MSLRAVSKPTGQVSVKVLQSKPKRWLTGWITAGAKTIVTLCGEDLGMLRSKYPYYYRAPQAKVLHTSEFLLPLIQKGRLTDSTRQTMRDLP